MDTSKLLLAIQEQESSLVSSAKIPIQLHDAVDDDDEHSEYASSYLAKLMLS